MVCDAGNTGAIKKAAECWWKRELTGSPKVNFTKKLWSDAVMMEAEAY